MAKGENIFKRKDGRWEGRYIKGYDNNHKIKYGFCYGHSYREAKEKVTYARSKLYNQATQKGEAYSKLTLLPMKEICNNWLDINKNKLKQSSYSKYSTIIEKHIIPEFGDHIITAITTDNVAKFTNRLLEHERLAVKTVRDILFVLHSILIYDCEQRSFQGEIIKIVYPKEERRELRVLNQEEQLRLMNHLETNTNLYKLGIMISLTTGLRVGEVCGLQWKDISLDKRILHVKSTVQRVKNQSEDSVKKTIVRIGTPKSKSSIRIVPLTDGIVKYCNQLKSENQFTFLLTGTTSFAEPRILQRQLTKYYKECGIADAHFHTLRHTFATRCIEVGCDVKSLSEILGHSNTSITMNRYVHPDLNLKRENIKKLEEAGFGCAVK